jgi:GNAT superfamily N-acetyltransferase
VARDLSSLRPGITSTQARLHGHFARALDCNRALLYRPGVWIVPTEARRRPEWHGWVLPLYGLAPAGTGACVLSCLPELAGALERATRDLPAGAQSFDGAWLAAVRAVAGTIAGAEWSRRVIYVADAATFRPHGVDPSVRVERLEPAAHPDLWLSRAFDGPCFVIRDGSGGIAAWAGVKRKSDDAWEIAAVTEPPYRGRGLATVLTARATAEILDQGRLALWVADIDNVLSRRLVERLGFEIYGEQVAAALFDPALSLPPPPPPASP